MKTVGAHSSKGTRGVFVLGLLDVAVATVAAVLVFWIFGVQSVAETNPPICYNSSGQVVSCSLTAPMLMPPIFGVVLLGLAAWQTRRWWKQRA